MAAHPMLEENGTLAFTANADLEVVIEQYRIGFIKAIEDWQGLPSAALHPFWPRLPHATKIIICIRQNHFLLIFVILQCFLTRIVIKLTASAPPEFVKFQGRDQVGC